MEDTGSWVSVKDLRWAADIRSVYKQEEVTEEQPYHKAEDHLKAAGLHAYYLSSEDRPRHRRGVTALSAELELVKAYAQITALTKELKLLKEKHDAELHALKLDYERKLDAQKEFFQYLTANSEATDSPLY